jgi:hypothetical protein
MAGQNQIIITSVSRKSIEESHLPDFALEELSYNDPAKEEKVLQDLPFQNKESNAFEKAISLKDLPKSGMIAAWNWLI